MLWYDIDGFYHADRIREIIQDRSTDLSDVV